MSGNKKRCLTYQTGSETVNPVAIVTAYFDDEIKDL
jgi:hypothetical protein